MHAQVMKPAMAVMFRSQLNTTPPARGEVQEGQEAARSRDANCYIRGPVLARLRDESRRLVLAREGDQDATSRIHVQIRGGQKTAVSSTALMMSGSTGIPASLVAITSGEEAEASLLPFSKSSLSDGTSKPMKKMVARKRQRIDQNVHRMADGTLFFLGSRVSPAPRPTSSDPGS